MIGDHSALDLVLQASLIVQFVMALLAGASVVSWAIIFRKRTLLNAERLAADRFEEQFWSGGDLAALYKSLEAGSPTGMVGVFVAGFREFSRLRKQAGIAGAQLLEGSRRAMRVAQLRETDRTNQWGNIDSDGDGYVSLAELDRAAPALSESFSAMDVDGDKKLTHGEFRTWHESHKAKTDADPDANTASGPNDRTR